MYEVYNHNHCGIGFSFHAWYESQTYEYITERPRLTLRKEGEKTLTKEGEKTLTYTEDRGEKDTD